MKREDIITKIVQLRQSIGKKADTDKLAQLSKSELEILLKKVEQITPGDGLPSHPPDRGSTSLATEPQPVAVVKEEGAEFCPDKYVAEYNNDEKEEEPTERPSKSRKKSTKLGKLPSEVSLDLGLTSREGMTAVKALMRQFQTIIRREIKSIDILDKKGRLHPDDIDHLVNVHNELREDFEAQFNAILDELKPDVDFPSSFYEKTDQFLLDNRTSVECYLL